VKVTNHGKTKTNRKHEKKKEKRKKSDSLSLSLIFYPFLLFFSSLTISSAHVLWEWDDGIIPINVISLWGKLHFVTP
jgi:hypothetical protein